MKKLLILATRNTDAGLTPDAARNLSPRLNCQCRLPCGLDTAHVCNCTHHLYMYAHVKHPKSHTHNICGSAHMLFKTHTQTHTCVHTHTHTHTIYVAVHTCCIKHTHTHTHVCTHTHMYKTHTHMCAHTHTCCIKHTHTHVV